MGYYNWGRRSGRKTMKINSRPKLTHVKPITPADRARQRELIAFAPRGSDRRKENFESM